MHHSLFVEDFGIRMRPVRMDDAPFIVWLRNQEYVRGKVGDSAADIASQESWLESYFQREGDYYFIIETTCCIPVGTYGIYDVKDREGESGRWIVRPMVPAAIPSVILAFNVAFGWLQLDRLRVHTVSTNHRVLSLNRRLGFQQTKVHTASQIIDGKAVDMVQFELRAKDWPKHRERILPLARRAEEEIRNWEQSAAPGVWQSSVQ